MEEIDSYILYFEDGISFSKYKFTIWEVNLFKNLELNKYYTLKELGIDE